MNEYDILTFIGMTPAEIKHTVIERHVGHHEASTLYWTNNTFTYVLIEYFIGVVGFDKEVVNVAKLIGKSIGHGRSRSCMFSPAAGY